MTFSEITTKLLTLDNCAMLIKTQHGTLFIQDLHKYVRLSSRIVSKVANPKGNVIAEATKDQLKEVLENYPTARRMPVGSKRPR